MSETADTATTGSFDTRRARVSRALPREERLLCLLNLARVDGADSAEIGEQARRILAVGVDWEKLLRLAELNAVVPLVLRNLEALGLLERVPSTVLEPWQALAAPVRARNEKRVEWAGRMLRAMHEAGIEVIVLKGSMFAEEIYRDPYYKKMNDVDVLIRREDAGKAVGVLQSIGFTGVGALFGKEEISAKSHHTPPFVSQDLGCVVGLHWGLSSPLAPWKPDTGGIWKRKSAVQVAGAPAFRMSWEDNLLHLCIHLPFFKIGLRELADVYNLVRFCEPGVDWHRLAQLARRWKAQDPVYRVLALTQALVDLGIPSAAGRRLWTEWREASTAFTVADTDKRLARPEVILASRSTQAAKIEKAFAMFMLTEKYSEKVQAWAGMWKFLLWPKEQEVRKLSGEASLENPSSLIRARLKAPVQIWNALARDHGQLPLAAMTLINAGIVARETLARPISHDGPSLREHPAARLLEVLE